MITVESIFDELVRQTVNILPDLRRDGIVSQDSLKSLGANSMDRADIIMMTLEQLELKTPLAEFATASNLGELAALIHAKKVCA
jgi:polyketide biosynthesis acyl carrier protein